MRRATRLAWMTPKLVSASGMGRRYPQCLQPQTSKQHAKGVWATSHVIGREMYTGGTGTHYDRDFQILYIFAITSCSSKRCQTMIGWFSKFVKSVFLIHTSLFATKTKGLFLRTGLLIMHLFKRCTLCSQCGLWGCGGPAPAHQCDHRLHRTPPLATNGETGDAEKTRTRLTVWETLRCQ